MIKLEHIPEGLDQIVAAYGVPGAMQQDGRFSADRTWVSENIRIFQLPFPLRRSWDLQEIRAFPAHRAVGDAMVDALAEIQEFYGLSYLRRYHLDLWGGVYNPRAKRGTMEPSVHAWGLAIDYCPELGPLGEPSRMPWPIVEAFLKRGFETFPKTDSMHHQAVRGY